jgi:hypothetical protein
MKCGDGLRKGRAGRQSEQVTGSCRIEIDTPHGTPCDRVGCGGYRHESIQRTIYAVAKRGSNRPMVQSRSAALERRGQGADRGGILCAGRDRVGDGAPAQHLTPAPAWRESARDGALGLPADTAPLFVRSSRRCPFYKRASVLRNSAHVCGRLVKSKPEKSRG